MEWIFFASFMSGLLVFIIVSCVVGCCVRRRRRGAIFSSNIDNLVFYHHNITRHVKLFFNNIFSFIPQRPLQSPLQPNRCHLLQDHKCNIQMCIPIKPHIQWDNKAMACQCLQVSRGNLSSFIRLIFLLHPNTR